MLQPPTDSLYKFLAVGGIVLICVSLFLPDKPLDDFIKAWGEFARENTDWKNAHRRFSENSTLFERQNAEEEEKSISISEESDALDSEHAKLETLLNSASQDGRFENDLKRRVTDYVNRSQEQAGQLRDQAP